jgi:hypothetical protein
MKVPPPPRAELELLASVRGEYAFYRWHNVTLCVWLATATLGGVTRLATLDAENAESLPGGVTAIHWLESGVGLPSAEVRASLRNTAEGHRNHLHCLGVVLNGGGFWASALRSALTGITLLSSRAIPTRFFSEANECAQWVAEKRVARGEKRPDAAALGEMIAQAVASAKAVAA